MKRTENTIHTTHSVPCTDTYHTGNMPYGHVLTYNRGVHDAIKRDAYRWRWFVNDARTIACALEDMQRRGEECGNVYIRENKDGSIVVTAGSTDEIQEIQETQKTQEMQKPQAVVDDMDDTLMLDERWFHDSMEGISEVTTYVQTDRAPHDTAVLALLILFKSHFGDAVELATDATTIDEVWQAIQLVGHVFGPEGHEHARIVAKHMIRAYA